MARPPGPAAATPLAQALRSARRDLNLTLAEVGRRAHLSESYVSRLETGRRSQLNRDSAAALAEVLHLDVDEVCRLGGVLPDLPSDGGFDAFERVVAADEQLTTEQQSVLLALYRTWHPG